MRANAATPEAAPSRAVAANEMTEATRTVPMTAASAMAAVLCFSK